MCGGLGRCEGEGTRLGDGECVCDPGYSGHLCQSCADGYFREKSSNDSIGACAGAFLKCSRPHGFISVWGHHKPTLSLSPCLSPSVACYHSCKKCAGPQDYKCLDCKPGWMLHDNKCVGECCSRGHVATVNWVCARYLKVWFDCPCMSFRHWRMWHRAGSLPFQHLLSQHRWIIWMQRYAPLCSSQTSDPSEKKLGNHHLCHTDILHTF